MIKRLRHMLIKEFLQLFRDPRMRAVVFLVPVLQMLVFAFALTTDIANIRTAVIDADKTVSSREFLERLTSSGHFRIVAYTNSEAEIRRLLDRGYVAVAIDIPAGFEHDLTGNRTASVQLIADGTDSTTTSVTLGYASVVAAEYNQERLMQRLSALGPGRVPGQVQIQTRAWFNPNLESRFYYVPSLVALMLVLVSMILTSVSIVCEKEIGTIEQVMVTPISRLEFILGKTVPYGIIGYITMTIMLGLAMLVFGVRVHGSWLLLYTLTGLYLVSNMGLALFISSSASTQQQAMLTAFLLMFPIMLLSGFLFPVRNMPVIVQYATFLNPMRWFLECLRGVVIKGVGIHELWHAILGQSVLAVAYITLAVSRFRKTMG